MRTLFTLHRTNAGLAQHFAILWATLFCLLVPILQASAFGGHGYASEISSHRPVATPQLKLHIVRSLPHDPGAFTQGFFVADGYFYESTGRYGESELRKIELESGRVVQRRPLPEDLFGEGLALSGSRIIQLTWKSGRALLWDLRTLGRAGEAQLDREAWGLASGPKQLYFSDGSERISLLEPESMQFIGEIVVHDGQKAVSQLNELEYVRGFLLANIWFEDLIAVIEPESGQVIAWIDLSPLRKRLESGAGVANGIAWDGERLYVTGKNWDAVFEIDVLQAPWHTPNR